MEAYDSLDVRYIILIQLKSRVHLHCRYYILGLVAIENFDDQNFLRRYLNIDLILKVLFILESFVAYLSGQHLLLVIKDFCRVGEWKFGNGLHLRNFMGLPLFIFIVEVVSIPGDLVILSTCLS